MFLDYLGNRCPSPPLTLPIDGNAESVPVKGKLVFEDDFDRELSERRWRIKEKFAGLFSFREGMVVGKELLNANHGSVVRVPIAEVNIILEFDFIFNWGKTV